MNNSSEEANRKTRQVWDANASFWDEHMGEGNDFVELLLWPVIEKLLPVKPGQRILDIACGNGLTSRRLAAQGAELVAFDFSEKLLELAERKPNPGSRISYQLLDATDQAGLLGLGISRFDAALCNMALFDMAEIQPLFRALSQLLKPAGAFVFSVVHPAFNNPSCVHLAEKQDLQGEIVTTFAIKVSRYLTPFEAYGLAIQGQPKPQLYFHRALQDLLRPGFEAGFILDALEERAFPPGQETRHFLGWHGQLSEIPPVMIIRMRLLDHPENR